MSDPWLAGPVTSVAYGWRLERGDGVTLGFTSHDRDVTVDGVLLRSSPGMLPSSIVESIGLETDGLEVNGALTASAIRSDDLASGRWDAARLEIFLFDWSEPEAGKRILAVGELGAVSYSGDAFQAELLGLTRLLDRPVVPQTSPGCRASFCDAGCGLNPLRYRHVSTVSLVDDETITLTSAATANVFGYGQLRWLDGPNTGLTADIIANNATQLIVARPPHFPVTTGTRIELVEGCDKRLETCATRFANAINFRGEPHLPGNDLLTRYPGAG
ncbi:MAG: DUF2163 domain-containing protein [Sphingorhabdus sp.]